MLCASAHVQLYTHHIIKRHCLLIKEYELSVDRVYKAHGACFILEAAALLILILHKISKRDKRLLGKPFIKLAKALIKAIGIIIAQLGLCLYLGGTVYAISIISLYLFITFTYAL